MWEDEEDQLFNCPMKFVTSEIIEWYTEYSYNKEFNGTAPAYHEQSTRFIDAADHYKSCLNELMNRKKPHGR